MNENRNPNARCKPNENTKRSEPRNANLASVLGELRVPSLQKFLDEIHRQPLQLGDREVQGGVVAILN